MVGISQNPSIDGRRTGDCQIEGEAEEYMHMQSRFVAFDSVLNSPTPPFDFDRTAKLSTHFNERGIVDCN